MNKAAIHLAFTVSATVLSSYANLLVNGDFEAGNTGFMSTYIYSVSDSIPNADGVYYVGSNSKAWNGNFPAPVYDHTSGSGLMLLADASNNRSIVWQETVTVQEGREYEFTGWFASLADYTQPKLELIIDGQAVAAILPSKLVWSQLSASWTATKTGEVNIAIRDLYTQWLGNDFAMDDLYFDAKSTVDIPVILFEQPMNSNGCVEAVSPEGAVVSAYVDNYVDATNIVYSWSTSEGETATGPFFDFPLGLNQSTIVFLTVKDLQTADEASSFEQVRVCDTTGPSIEILTPVEGDCFYGNNISLKVAILDAVDTNMLDYTVYIGKTTTYLLDPETGLSDIKLYKSLPDNGTEPTVITVTAEDSSGNSSEESVQVLLQHDNRTE